MAYHENYMKKYNIKTTYILAINLKPVSEFEEKSQFLNGSKNM